MTSRRGELLVTRAVQEIINALNPAGAYVRGQDFVDGMESQSGVFLEGKDMIVSDSFWMEWHGGERKAIRRRLIVNVRAEETEIASTS